MEKETLNFILDSLTGERTKFYSFKQHYALMLLEQILEANGGAMPVRELKTSPYKSLLNCPHVKKVLATIGSKELQIKDLYRYLPDSYDYYRLTLGNWPEWDDHPDTRWCQTTRRGWNLVLQLNMPISHIRELAQYVDDWQRYIEDSLHPISQSELTLAWARIDLDFDTGEALIEEIQSDWIRDVAHLAKSSCFQDWESYWTKKLKVKAKSWSETMLTAAIWFLQKELGLKSIFYHSFESGNRLKQIDARYPPRSIYSELPKRFCFQKTHNGPRFIYKDAKKKAYRQLTDPATEWYLLEL